MTAENLALFLATRQKRLQYLRSTFKETLSSHAQGGEDEAADVREKLTVYGLLLSRLTKEISEIERTDAKSRLLTLDRELTSLFERRRLRTSALTPRDGQTTIVMKPR